MRWLRYRAQENLQQTGHTTWKQGHQSQCEPEQHANHDSKADPTFRTFTSKIGIFAAIDFPTIMFVFRSNKKYGKIELTLCGL